MTDPITTAPRECPITRHRAVDCPSGGVCRFAQQVPPAPATAVELLVAHQRQGSRSCIACGDLPLGASSAGHQAAVLAAAGLFRPDAPTPTPAEVRCEHGSTLDALCRSMTGHARGIPQPPHGPTPAGDDQPEALAKRDAWDAYRSRVGRMTDARAGFVWGWASALAARPSAPTVTTEQIEQAAQAAFLSDDLGGHIKGPHSWDTIPEVGRENYRRLVRAILAALGTGVAQ